MKKKQPLSIVVSDLRAIEANIVTLKQRARNVPPQMRPEVVAELEAAVDAARKLRSKAGIVGKVYHGRGK